VEIISFNETTISISFLFIGAHPWQFLSSCNSATYDKERFVKQSKNIQIMMGALNLLALVSPMAVRAGNHSGREQKQEQLNATSLKSMESSWLKVPALCKAKGFNANPVSLDSQELSAFAKTAYASYAG
jgi:hypothetical protein